MNLAPLVEALHLVEDAARHHDGQSSDEEVGVEEFAERMSRRARDRAVRVPPITAVVKEAGLRKPLKYSTCRASFSGFHSSSASRKATS